MPACGVSSLAEDEREQRGEGQVDEVRRLDQTDRQEELAGQLTLRLGLPSDAADQSVTGDAVTDARADRAAAGRQPAPARPPPRPRPPPMRPPAVATAWVMSFAAIFRLSPSRTVWAR